MMRKLLVPSFTVAMVATLTACDNDSTETRITPIQPTTTTNTQPATTQPTTNTANTQPSTTQPTTNTANTQPTTTQPTTNTANTQPSTTQPTTNTANTQPTTTNNQSTQIGQYRLDTTPANKDTYLQQVNQLAKEGYAFVSPTTQGLLSYQPNHSINIEYVSDSRTVNLNVLNDMGKQGYLYKMPSYDSNFQRFNLYLKNTGSNKTYQYQAIKSSEPFLNKTNEIAKNGWRYHSMHMLEASPHYLYVNDNSNTSYEYALEADNNNLSKFREQITNRAKDGWIYRGGLAFGTELFQLFERPTTNSKAFTCEVVETPTSIDLTLMNNYAKQGYISLGKQVIGSQSIETFCKDTSNVWHPLAGAMLP